MIFGNVNFDLMYGLPQQTVEEARADLAAALAFAPPHLSFYHLTLEPNTLFHRYPPPLPDDDTAADIEDAVHATLEGAGYQHYETSAYAKPGRAVRAQCQLLALRRLSRHRRRRAFQAFVRRPHRAAVALEAAEAIPRTHRAGPSAAGRGRGDARRCRLRVHAERAAADRRRARALFAERTGYPLALVAQRDRAATRAGLLEPDPASLKPTELGRRFLNDLQALFLTDARERPQPRRGRAARAHGSHRHRAMTQAPAGYALTLTEAAEALAEGRLDGGRIGRPRNSRASGRPTPRSRRGSARSGARAARSGALGRDATARGRSAASASASRTSSTPPTCRRRWARRYSPTIGRRATPRASRA